MYAAKTQTEWMHIEQRINTMFQAREQQVSSLDKFGYTDEMQREDVKAAIPSDFAQVTQAHPHLFDTSHSIKAGIPYGDAHLYHTIVSFSTPVRGTTEMFARYGQPKIIINADRARDAVTKMQTAQEQIRKEKATLISKLKTLWDAAPSVNALLKTWPPIEEFLSTAVKERVQRKAEKGEKKIAEAVSEEDINALSTQLLIAKVCK